MNWNRDRHNFSRGHVDVGITSFVRSAPPPFTCPGRCGCKEQWCLSLSCCWSGPANKTGQSSTSVPVGSSRLHSLQIVRNECACTNCVRSTTKWSSSASVHFGEAENTLWGPQQDKVRCTSSLHPTPMTLPGRGLNTGLQNSTRVMDRVLMWEQPDLVVYTGGM